jgi:hypothetical protein
MNQCSRVMLTRKAKCVAFLREFVRDTFNQLLPNVCEYHSNISNWLDEYAEKLHFERKEKSLFWIDLATTL